MRTGILILGVLLCSAATAEPQPWMKSSDSESLRYVVVVNPDCPVSEAELRSTIDGLLIRSRLRPGDFRQNPYFLGFYVGIECMHHEGRLFVYSIDTSFIRLAWSRFLLETPTYGTLGLGSKVEISNDVRSSVERLVTDYLQANFDLTPE
jgi:hypothetical protein